MIIHATWDATLSDCICRFVNHLLVVHLLVVVIDVIVVLSALNVTPLVCVCVF